MFRFHNVYNINQIYSCYIFINSCSSCSTLSFSCSTQNLHSCVRKSHPILLSGPRHQSSTKVSTLQKEQYTSRREDIDDYSEMPTSYQILFLSYLYLDQRFFKNFLESFLYLWHPACCLSSTLFLFDRVGSSYHASLACAWGKWVANCIVRSPDLPKFHNCNARHGPHYTSWATRFAFPTLYA